MKDIKTLNQLVAPKPVSYGIGQMKYSGIPLVNVSVIAKAPAKRKKIKCQYLLSILSHRLIIIVIKNHKLLI